MRGVVGGRDAKRGEDEMKSGGRKRRKSRGREELELYR